MLREALWADEDEQSYRKDIMEIQDWQYPLGLHSTWKMKHVISQFHSNDPDIKHLRQLKPGIYNIVSQSGTTEPTFPTKVRVNIGRERKLYNKFGVFIVTPISTTVSFPRNPDISFKFKSLFDRQKRLHMEINLSVNDRQNTKYSCDMSKVSFMHKDHSPAIRYFKYPPKGTILHYHCEGHITELTLKIKKNNGRSVEFSHSHSRGRGRSAGPEWNIFFGLIPTNILDETFYVINKTQLQSRTFSNLVNSRLHHGKIQIYSHHMSEAKSLPISGNYFIFIQQPKTQKFNQFQKLTTTTIQSTLDTKIRKTEHLIAYAEELSAPIKIAKSDLYTAPLDSGPNPREYTCYLARISQEYSLDAEWP